MIYSPDVVFFRDDYGNLMDHVEINVLTAAAPNNRNVFEKQSVLEAIFCARIEKVLKVAIDTGNRNIILGAWGCGAFCNDPEMVAICFDAVIKSTNWDIDNIVFAIMDTHEEKLISTFRKVLK
jgi:uncharacterized protein (TIGR02452 family)